MPKKEIILTTFAPISPQTLQRRITFKNYPGLDKAAAVCAAIEKVGFRTLLAGGCPRDILLGKEIKDFDIFVVVPEHMHRFKIAFAIYKALLPLGIDLSPRDGDGYGSAFLILDAGQIQVLLTYIAKNQIVSTFNCALCEAWMVPDATGFDIHASADFTQAARHKVLAFYKGEKLSVDWVTRLKAKFSDYLPVEITRTPRSNIEIDIAREPIRVADFDDDVPF